MITDTQKRQQILRKIHRIPNDKLNELDDFISKFEQEIEKKTRVLSFAGAWQNVDDSVLNDFTENLIVKRQENKRRNNE